MAIGTVRVQSTDPCTEYRVAVNTAGSAESIVNIFYKYF